MTNEFSHIKLSWSKSDFTIQFLSEGYATESFIIINYFFQSFFNNIRGFFLIRSTDEGEVKEFVETTKILTLGYKGFIHWLTDHTAKGSLISSGDFEAIPLSGIELRFDKEYNIYPKYDDCKSIIDSITKWTLT
jgi:hypothetical protein